MVEKHKEPEHVTVQFGGMGLYGTTSNMNVAHYQVPGDIENADHPDKGSQKEQGYSGAVASIDKIEQRD